MDADWSKLRGPLDLQVKVIYSVQANTDNSVLFRKYLLCTLHRQTRRSKNDGNITALCSGI